MLLIMLFPYINIKFKTSDQPVTPGAKFKIRDSELWLFDKDLALNELSTVSKIGRLRNQLAGKEPVSPPTPNGTQPFSAGESTKEYKSMIRANMAALDMHANAGDVAANEHLATEDVIVVANGETKTGRRAFADIAAAINQG